MSDGFVWPGSGIDPATPVWGHRNGMRVGIAPTRGPRGLLRIYAPYLAQSFPRVVNFISIEPTVDVNQHRSQSELATSNHQPGTEGLAFYASDSPDGYDPAAIPAGRRADDGSSLTVFIHTETFPDGAQPVIGLCFNAAEPHEMELTTLASSESAAMASCVLSATMGNFGMLRRLDLADGEVSSSELWDDDDPLDRLGFLPWRTFGADRLATDGDGRYMVSASTDVRHVDIAYDTTVADHWHYHGLFATHTWKAEPATDPVVAVNARRTYWRSQAPIPGGASFENFELRTPFEAGQRFWFRVDARSTIADFLAG